jgi:glyoxylase-like metal-dependent hydrolase (beta-lactamase superfamily II)
MDRNFLLESDTVATAADPTPRLERTDVLVYNLVIDHPDGTILWDTGSHHAAADGHWPEWLYNVFEHHDADEYRLDDSLARAGYDVEDVDYVVQSHLHMDHAGGLEFFAGTDTPVFVHRAELEFAYYSAKTGAGSAGYVLADFDHDLNWQPVLGDDETLFEGVEVHRLLGHTPGLFGLVVHLDSGPTLLVTSDVADLAANYEDGVPPGPGILTDREAWQRSRQRLRALEREHDATVLYGHDPGQRDLLERGWP